MFLCQRVLLQPSQSGARLLPEEEDGRAGLPPHLPDRRLPQSAGPHHGHQPHHGGNHSILLLLFCLSIKLSSHVEFIQIDGCAPGSEEQQRSGAAGRQDPL